MKQYLGFVHSTAIGYYFLLTVCVLYSSIFIAYPVIYKDDKWKIFENTYYLIFITLNMMGNYFLACYRGSEFTSGIPLRDPPKSFHFCPNCNQHCPPRSHHCTLCNACVLKRDHHCFFIGRCVGLKNQRFFIVFTLYVALGCLHSVRVLFAYLNEAYIPVKLTLYTLSSYLLPGFFYNWIWVKEIDTNITTLICIMILYCSLTTGIGCMSLFAMEMICILRGQTPHDFMIQSNKYNEGFYTNLTKVFGTFWFLSFLLPLPLKNKDEKSLWGSPSYYKSV